MLGILGLKSYQVEALEAVCFNKHDTLLCVLTGSRKSACFEGMCTVINTSLADSEDLGTASVIGQMHIGLQSAPLWHYGVIRLAPTQWWCGSDHGVWSIASGIARPVLVPTFE